MAITSGQVGVTTTAALLTRADSDGCAVTIHVADNSAIYVGGSAVTTTTGLYIDKGSGPSTFHINAGDALYAVATVGTAVTTYLRID